MIKPRTLLLSLALGLATAGLLPLAGCKTAADGSRTVDSDRVSRIAGTAAQLGTTIYLAQHPEQRPSFAAAEQALTALADRQNYDPAAFSAALQGLPINELKGPNGSLYVSVALVVWDEVAAQATGVDKEELVKKTLVAVRDGLRRSLGPPAPPMPPAN